MRRSLGYHMLNLIAIDLQLYKIFKIMRVSFLAHIEGRSINKLQNDIILLIFKI